MKASSVMLLAVLGLAALAAVTAQQNSTFAVNGISMKVSGKSGKVTLIKGDKDDIETNPNKLEIKFLGIQEVDEDGAVVGKSGKLKHSFNSFASQDFTISPLNPSSSYQGIDAASFHFQSNLLDGSANFTAQVWILKAAGTITEGDEEVDVSAGNVKINFEMRDWTFCDPSAVKDTNAYCKNSAKAGAYLDLSVGVKSKTKPSKEAAKAAKEACKNGGTCKKPEKIAMGGGVAMDLMSNVNVDGTIQTMPADYPMLDGTTFTFRLPKFTNYVIYDPVVDMDSEGNAGAATAPTFFAVLLAIASMMMLLA